MTVALLTAIYDGYDALHRIPKQDLPFEAICVTDDPNLRSDSWDVRYEPRPGVHPNLAAKRPKCAPWRYTDADTVVWLDAAFQILSPRFIVQMDQWEFGQFAHNHRDCIYQEVEHSISLAKYQTEPLAEQASYYRLQMGHPEHWGLWATGFIVRRHTPAIEKFGEGWLTQCETFSFQDQVSEAPMLRHFGLRPDTIPGFYGQGQNPWFAHAPSARH